MIACVFVLMMTGNVWTDQPKKPFSLQSLTGTSGVLIDGLGKLQITTDAWDVVAYVNLNDLNTKIDHLELAIAETGNLCKSKQLSSCHMHVQLFEKTMKRLISEKGLLENFLAQGRSKRGLLNIIGDGAKILFGTLSDADGQRYDTLIDQLTDKQKKLTDIVSRQTSIIQNTIHTLNDTLGHVEHNEQLLAKSMDWLKKDLTEQRNTLQEHILFESHSDILSLLIHLCQIEMNNLLNAVVAAKQGIVHPFLITSDQILRQLQTVIGLLPSGKTFPIDVMTNVSAQILLEISSIKVLLKHQYLVCIVSIPLVEADAYQIFKLTSVPLPLQGTKYIKTLIKYPIVAINERSDLVITVSADEFSRFKGIGNKYFIGTSAQPISDEVTCETELIRPVPNLAPNCSKAILNVIHPIYLSIEKPNTWVYVLPAISHQVFTITCLVNGSTMVDKVAVNGSGIIQLSSGCTAKCKDKTLRAYERHVSILRQNHTDSIYNVLTNFTSFYSQAVTLPPKQLDQLSFKPNEEKHLNDVLQDLNRLRQEEDKSYTTNVHYSIFYTLLAVMLVILLILGSIKLSFSLKRRSRRKLFKGRVHEEGTFVLPDGRSCRVRLASVNVEDTKV